MSKKTVKEATCERCVYAHDNPCPEEMDGLTRPDLNCRNFRILRLWKSLKYKGGKIVSGYDGSPWIIGVWRAVPKPIKECDGLNCCEYIQDAMGYVNMEILAEVEIDGHVIIGDDKITCEKMRILKAYHWEKEDAVAMSSYAAELVIGYYEQKYPNDDRPRRAIEAAKEWLKNPTAANAAYAANAASDAAYAAYSASDAAAYSDAAARSAYSDAAAYSAARSARSAAKIKMKNQIHDWIVNHISELTEIK